MSLPVNDKNNKKNKGQKSGSQGSKFIIKPNAAKPAGGAAKKANRTGGTRGS
ncbi:MAG TPA: hypothetical protein VF145_02440 [Chitinophagaceae bacterium]